MVCGQFKGGPRWAPCMAWTTALMMLLGLQAAMQKAGLSGDCSACEDARTAAANMKPEDIARLPLPGEVEFIMGGPPCQGYSGMNR